MNEKIRPKKTIIWKVLTPVIALCFFVAVPPLAAQDYEQQGQQQEQEKVDFSDEDLEKFAEARTEVDKIRDEYSEELNDVEDDQEKAQQLQEKYAKQMVESIQETGLDVQKYNKISMAMQNDPELKSQVDKMAE